LVSTGLINFITVIRLTVITGDKLKTNPYYAIGFLRVFANFFYAAMTTTVFLFKQYEHLLQVINEIGDLERRFVVKATIKMWSTFYYVGVG